MNEKETVILIQDLYDGDFIVAKNLTTAFDILIDRRWWIKDSTYVDVWNSESKTFEQKTVLEYFGEEWKNKIKDLTLDEFNNLFFDNNEVALYKLPIYNSAKE